MAITFSPQHANHGFDGSVTPPWQMVPLGGTRQLTLLGVGSLVMRVRHPRILQATQFRAAGNVMLALRGLREGKAIVEWVAARRPQRGLSLGPMVAMARGAGVAFGAGVGLLLGIALRSALGTAAPGFSLEVSVKKQKRIHTAFHYVDDGRVQKTARSIAALNGLIAGTNTILDRQANVEIVRKSAAALAIAQNLGSVVRFSSHLAGVAAAEHEWDDIVRHADAAADFNVYFVKEYEQDNTPGVDNTRAGTIAAEKNCILEDNIANTSETLAHETVHLLGIGRHSGTASHLIASGAVRTGQTISKAQANRINPSGT